MDWQRYWGKKPNSFTALLLTSTKWQVAVVCFFYESNVNLTHYLENQIIFLDKHQQGHWLNCAVTKKATATTNEKCNITSLQGHIGQDLWKCASHLLSKRYIRIIIYSSVALICYICLISSLADITALGFIHQPPEATAAPSSFFSVS